MAADTLVAYRAKRDFGKTGEPSGAASAKSAKTASGGSFVIHKHDATRLHYDLRLEHDGVLWSWAVTRGPSLDPHEKRLAVHVEDHPLDYGSFEGNIPEGEYGAGAVIVWDKGEWTPEYDPAFGMKKGHISFTLKGDKLHGAWHLVRLKPRGKEKRDNWLLIKVEDGFARTDGDILEDEPASVTSGRTIEDIAAGKPPVKAKPAKAAHARKARATKAAGEAAKAPDFVPPALATLKPQPPPGGEWLHEVKFDGYRIQAHLAGGAVRLLTRTGLDWTPKFGRAIADAIASLDCAEAVIDGEIAVLSDKGVASFSSLQAALSANATDCMIFFAFDLLFLDGADLREEALVERKHRLAGLIGQEQGEEAALRYSEHFVEPGKTMLRHACRMGLEGVISKLADAPYRSGRSLDWIKSKCTNRQEFVIVGYLPSTAPGRGLRSLLVGYHEGEALRFGGRVGTGFTQSSVADLKRKLDRLLVKSSPFVNTPPGQKGVVWVRPDLVAEIEFRAWTDDGILRHASFQGVREDKPANEVVAELAVDDPKDKAEKLKSPKTRPAKPGAARRKPEQTAVTLSHPEKLLWPDAGISKRGLLDYYASVWPRMEKQVVRRPLSLVRAPDGVGAPQRFFQKHASKGMHASIARIRDPEDGEDILFVNDFDGIAALVQMGTVEIHVWGSTIEDLDRPDMVVFDLDPDEGLGREAVIAATRDVRSRLDELALQSFLKTSGGKGYHVVVPLTPKADWKTVKTFSHDFARAMAEASPDLYTATLSKKSRSGKIFIDYLRNGRGSTAVAAYSARAKAAGTVSMPVPWSALDDDVAPDHFTMTNDATPNVIAGADPWSGFDKARKTLDRNG